MKIVKLLIYVFDLRPKCYQMQLSLTTSLGPVYT